MEKIKVSIVEDTEDIRIGLKFLIENTSSFEVNCVCNTAEEAIAQISSFNTNVILMDIGLPGKTGIEATRILKEKFPAIQIIICSVFDSGENIFNALEAGATGYILKKSMAKDMVNAITDVLNGGSPMSSEIARKVVASFHSRNAAINEFNKLTLREQEILQLLSKGFRYKEIAPELFVSIDTVRTHIRHIYEKLQVQSRTEAINKALLNK